MKTPEFLGPYRIGETLGRGGMGTVYKGVHEKSGEEVAVKLIATQVSDEMKFRRRFHGEVETLKRLKHDNIVHLVGYGEEHGMLFYSMEYVAGETLQTIIRREKRVSWAKALDIAVQICGALKHAHDMGVIHRDLKPANLIVQEDGTVKLVDFGISKIFGFDQTAAGSVMGTADYMAPEQATDAGITSRTDLYSLGCVMYSMLCGKPPFRGKNITEVIDALKHKDAVSLDLIDPDLPEEIVDLVHQLLSKLPEDRPPTALAVGNRLKAMRAGLQRMQTLAGEDPKTESTDQPLGNDTTSSANREPSSQGTDVAVDQVKPNDTIKGGDARFEQTQVSHADPSAKTIHSGGNAKNQHTVLGTGIQGKASVDSGGETSSGESGQTHFQTVTDGEMREGFFSADSSVQENALGRVLTIVAMAVALIACVVVLLVFLREPTADVLLAQIDELQQEGDTFRSHKLTDRFLSLYPDHPRVEQLRSQQTSDRVQRVVKRLRLQAKLRTSNGPLYETAFLEAMDLRDSDPAAAAKKLTAWLSVFQDDVELQDSEDDRVELIELAQFEASRLTQASASGAKLSDPRLIELLQQIQQSQTLDEEKREAALKGIIALSEGNEWAKPALEKAQALLESP